MREHLPDHHRVGIVAARLGDADMEQAVAGMGGRAAAVVLLVAQERLADRVELRVGRIDGREAGRLRLDQLARLQQRERRDLRVGIDLDAEFGIHLEPARTRQLRRLRRGRARAHRDAVADPHRHQADHLQRDQRLAHRGTRDAELRRQLALGRQVAARRKASRFDHRAQLVGDLLVETAVLDGLDRHAGAGEEHRIGKRSPPAAGRAGEREPDGDSNLLAQAAERARQPAAARLTRRPRGCRASRTTPRSRSTGAAADRPRPPPRRRPRVPSHTA